MALSVMSGVGVSVADEAGGWVTLEREDKINDEGKKEFLNF